MQEKHECVGNNGPSELSGEGLCSDSVHASGAEEASLSPWSLDPAGQNLVTGVREGSEVPAILRDDKVVELRSGP